MTSASRWRTTRRDDLPLPEFADIAEVTVERRACDADEIGDTACWSVEVVARLHEEVTGRDLSCGETRPR